MDRQTPEGLARLPGSSGKHLCWRTARQANRKQRDNSSDCEGADKIEHVQRRYKMSGAEQAEAHDANDKGQNLHSFSKSRSSAAEVWSNALTVGEAGRLVKGLRVFPFPCSVMSNCSRPRRCQSFAYVEVSLVPNKFSTLQARPTNFCQGIGRGNLTVAPSVVGGGTARTWPLDHQMAG